MEVVDLYQESLIVVKGNGRTSILVFFRCTKDLDLHPLGPQLLRKLKEGSTHRYNYTYQGGLYYLLQARLLKFPAYFWDLFKIPLKIALIVVRLY